MEQDTEFTDYTPLMAAVLEGHSFSVRRLLSYGHNPLEENAAGESALSLAHKHNVDKYIIELLTKAWK